MRIEYRTGDLLKGDVRVVCHGCNAQGKMGSGIAKSVREAYPAAFEAYEMAHRSRGLRVGEVSWAACGLDRVVANAVTQRFYGNSARTGVVYVDYEGVRACLRAIEAAAAGGLRDAFGAEVGPFDAVGFPLIGAGLAGGAWPRIAAIVEEESRSFRPVVYTLDGRVPAA
jgi:O-acetyl-ADP-ribose deacetylase (regulator of RNase III)